MYLEIDYEERNAGIRIWRCRGYGEVLKVPEMLEGKMVTELAPYALSSSRPAEEPDPSVIKHVVLKPEEKGFGEPSELCGKQLTEVYLPSGLCLIGDYAFYFCRNLKVIHFHGNIEEVGGGAFMWCRAVEQITFHEGGGGGSGWRDCWTGDLRQYTAPDGFTACVTNAQGETFSVPLTPRYTTPDGGSFSLAPEREEVLP